LLAAQLNAIGAWRKALDAYEAAIGRGPSNAQLFGNLGIVLAWQGDYLDVPEVLPVR